MSLSDKEMYQLIEEGHYYEPPVDDPTLGKLAFCAICMEDHLLVGWFKMPNQEALVPRARTNWCIELPMDVQYNVSEWSMCFNIYDKTY